VLGRFLFRWRGAIGVLAFGVVFWLARPTFGSCLFGLPIVLAGLATRFWASGYIGIEGRAREIGASRRIVSGPYRLLRHPLYIGNFLLVAGVLVALRPALWLGIVVLAGFVMEYTMIVVAEERELAGGRSQMSDVRCEMLEVRKGEERDPSESRSQKAEGRVQKAEVEWERDREIEGSRDRVADSGLRAESPESMGEEQGTVNWENRGQSLGAPASNVLGAPSGRAARYSPRFPRPCEETVPVLRQRPESFLLSRALCEWRTWVVSGVAFGLAVAKALLVRS
jgi:hypothetical protein